MLVTKAVLFDFDGLILDTETPFVTAWRELFAEFGCQFPDSCWKQMIGQSTPEASLLPYKALEEALGRPVEAEAFDDRCRARRLELIKASPAREGVHRLLDEIDRRGLRKAVVSSSRRSWVEGHLANLGLLDRFDLVVCGYEGHPSKPDPTLYRVALEKLGLLASEAVALEDSPFGIQAARDAGIYCIAVPNELTAQMPLEGADRVVTSLVDLDLASLLDDAAATNP